MPEHPYLDYQVTGELLVSGPFTKRNSRFSWVFTHHLPKFLVVLGFTAQYLFTNLLVFLISHWPCWSIPFADLHHPYMWQRIFVPLMAFMKNTNRLRNTNLPPPMKTANHHCRETTLRWSLASIRHQKYLFLFLLMSTRHYSAIVTKKKQYWSPGLHVYHQCSPNVIPFPSDAQMIQNSSNPTNPKHIPPGYSVNANSVGISDEW